MKTHKMHLLYCKRYYDRNKEKISKKQKENYQKNKEQKNERCKNYYQKNKEAEEKVKSLINELVEKDKDLNENLKEENQLLWVQKMNNYKNIPRIF